MAVASLAVVGGTTIGGELSPLTVGYGLLVGFAALYAIVGLVLRQGGWRRMTRVNRESGAETVAAHRVF